MESTKISDVQVRDTANAPAAAAPAAEPANSFGVSYVTDEKGRKIGLKKLMPSVRFQLSEDCAFKTQDGEMQGIIVASVVGIDQNGWPPVKDRADLMRRFDELDDHGLRAITPACLKIYGMLISQQDVLAAKN